MHPLIMRVAQRLRKAFAECSNRLWRIPEECEEQAAIAGSQRLPVRVEVPRNSREPLAPGYNCLSLPQTITAPLSLMRCTVEAGLSQAGPSPNIIVRAMNCLFHADDRHPSRRYRMSNRLLLTLLLTLAAMVGCEQTAVSEPPADTPAAHQSKASGRTAMSKVRVRLIDADGKLTGPVDLPKVIHTDAEWRKLLTAEQYKITRGKGTEAAFCGGLLNNKVEGVYACVCCGLPLFESSAKFESGTGWPSFFRPIAAENILEHSDRSHGMVRTEILCRRCDAHLGHVFDDGPRPTGLRYCLNSEALRFVANDELKTLADKTLVPAAAEERRHGRPTRADRPSGPRPFSPADASGASRPCSDRSTAS